MGRDGAIDQVVVPPGWLGDAVVALPAVRAIASLGSTLLLCHPRVAPLYGFAAPDLEVIPFRGPAHGPGGIAQARALRTRRVRRAVLIPRSASAALRGWLSGAPERIGFGGGPRGALLTRRVALDWEPRARHIAEEFALLARAAGAHDPEPAPRVAIPETAARLAGERLRALGLDDGRPLLAVCPGAAYGPAKRWFSARFAEVASLAARRGAAVLLLGGPADREVVDAVRSAADPAPADLCGATDVPLLAALLARARAALVNDSGPMHLAAAAGTPVVALFGSTNPEWTRPLGEGHAVLRYPVPCAPCYRRHCPIGRVCFDGIGAAAVAEAVAARLGLAGGWYTPAP